MAHNTINSLMDDTVDMASILGVLHGRQAEGYRIGPPSKRRRTEHTGEAPQKASEIPDQRVTPEQALRLDCDFITVTVGQDDSKTSFKVHEDAICDRSEFFAKAMKSEWASMRPDPRTIELPEDDPEAFALYRTWLYSGKLAIMPASSTASTTVAATNTATNTNANMTLGTSTTGSITTGSITTGPSTPGTTALRALTTPQSRPVTDSQLSLDPLADPDTHYHTLAYAYILGERLLDKPFKNAIADVYVLYARGNPPAKRYYPSNEEIRILYDGTRETSPIRQLLVDIWYCRGKVEWLDKDADLPSEFLAAVVKELFKVRQDGKDLNNLSRPWKLCHVQYHEE